MKVISIKTESTSYLIRLALEKELFLDTPFENYFFKIIIKLEDSDKFVDFMYRLLWEKVYLKSEKKSIYNPNNDTINMYVSLSEVIGFIHKATPPRLQNLIPESIKTIDSIIELMEQFLIDDNSGQLITYHSYFKEHFHFQPFETRWTYDKNRMKLLRRYNPLGVIPDIEVSNKSIYDIINYNNNRPEVSDIRAVITFHCYTKEDMKRVYDYIFSEDNYLSISNIMRDDTGTYITSYSNRLQPSDSLKSTISKTYDSIS